MRRPTTTSRWPRSAATRARAQRPGPLLRRRGGGPEAILGDKMRKGDVVIVRYEGPKGGPGMREMLSPTSAISRQGPGKGRGPDHGRPLLRRQPRPGGGPRRPEAAVGGPLGLIQDGDRITLDAVKNTLTLHVAARNWPGAKRVQGPAPLPEGRAGEVREAGQLRQFRRRDGQGLRGRRTWKKMKIALKGLVFDLDGTLLDQEGAERDALQRNSMRRDVEVATKPSYHGFLRDWRNVADDYLQRFLDNKMGFDEQRIARFQALYAKYGSDCPLEKAEKLHRIYAEYYRTHWRTFVERESRACRSVPSHPPSWACAFDDGTP